MAYIKMMTSDEAKEVLPAIKGLPLEFNLFAQHAADGTPLALTIRHQAAVIRATNWKNRQRALTFTD